MMSYLVAMVWQQIANGVDLALAIAIFILAILRDFSTNGVILDGSHTGSNLYELRQLSTVDNPRESKGSDDSRNPIFPGQMGVLKTVEYEICDAGPSQQGRPKMEVQ